MTVRWSGLVRGLVRFGVCAGLALIGIGAQAAPPSFTGQPATAPVPTAFQDSVFINLRQQGVLTGSASIRITVDAFALNGVTTQDLFIDAIDGGDTFGRVCLEVFNASYVLLFLTGAKLAWDALA